MAGGTKKSTKKFQKNHLKDTIDKRKEFAKVKQRQQIKAKKQARHVADFKKAEDFSTNDNASTQKDEGAAKDLSKMSVDEFFQGGFELPEKAKSKKKKDNAAPQITGKRKRNAESTIIETPSQTRNSSKLEEDGSDESGEEDLEMHKADIDALAEKDPEFYKYLKENDAELLDFDEDADLAGIDDLSEEEAPKKKAKKGKQEDESVVKMATVQKWRKAMIEQYSLRAMREVVLAFRAAAHLNSEDGKGYKYTVSSPEVYHEILVTTLEHVPTVLNHHLPAKETHNGQIKVSTDSKKFRTLTPLFKSHIASILHLLSSLSDASTIKLTLNAITSLIPYLSSFKKMLKSLIKTVVDVYSSSMLTDEATLITAFLLLQRLAVIGDPSIREAVLKQTYQGLVKGSRITNVHTLPSINLMKNSCVELWGLDANLGYTTGFTFIRQLAVHLRTSITRPTKDSYKVIYNWQYIHSLDFWSRVLSTHCSPASSLHLKTPTDSPLHPLIYPLVQITLGALRLIPTPSYFPLRFHLTRSLLRLSRTTATYIPLAPALLEVLQSPELSKPPRPSTLPPLDFSTSLRCPKSYLRTRIYQDGVGQQTQELLAEFFGCWAKSIAFPDLVIPPTVMLKRWLKSASSTPQRGGMDAHTGKKSEGRGNKNAKLNNLIGLLVQKMNANAEFVERARRNVRFGPGDREQVDGFLRDVEVGDTPLGAFVEGLRRTREERERVLEAGRRADERKKAGEKREGEAAEMEGLRSGLRGEMEVDGTEEEGEDGEEMEEEGDVVSEDD
ncbi:MAG: Nucleolar Complex 2 protein [Ramalina farinacea]|uniref:Nucleolar Complex 2 protein n=1 Tax=Ramalina farinacea TaxID=258253 RepID=A0AA43QU62_9LECA|nr:Nucleolar Complex 2 protein [Ramalina farinacea]